MSNPRIMVAVAALATVAAVSLAGCTEPGPHHFWAEGIQCESMPWDGEAYGGTDEERLGRLRGHYADDDRVTIVAAKIHQLSGARADVCGNSDGRIYEVTGSGLPSRDGWHHGPWPGEGDMDGA